MGDARSTTAGRSVRVGAIALALAACGRGHVAPGVPRGEPPARAWHYDFDVDVATHVLRARVCFAGPTPRMLIAGGPEAGEHLTGARIVSPPAAAAPARCDGRTIVLGALPDGACVEYTASIDVPEYPTPLGLRASDGSVLISTNAWLFYPPVRAARPDVTARFTLAHDAVVSVAWPREGSLYRLDASTFRLEGFAAFGRFPIEPIAVPGGVLEVAGFGDSLRPGAVDARTWLGSSAAVDADFYGTFPASRVQIVLLEAPAGMSEPIPFAETSHAGGESVTLARAADADATTLAHDGTVIHEFFHLGQPLLRDEDGWLSEGLATYYEQVLRVRAGRMTEAAAWQELFAGFARARADGDGRTLAEQSAGMHSGGHFARVYWTGAAVVFLTDVALRRAHATLDDAARALRVCCRDRSRVWTADDAIDRMDAATRGAGIVRATTARWLASHDPPDVSTAYRALGIRGAAEGNVTLDDTAPEAALRRAIMSR